MRKIKEVLRLHHEAGLSRRGVAQALNISYGSAVNYLNRAQKAGLQWPLPGDMDERTLGRLLFPSQAATGQRRFVEPDYQAFQQELKHNTLLNNCYGRSTANNILLTVTAMRSSVTAIRSG